jgi:hypothetical protein
MQQAVAAKKHEIRNWMKVLHNTVINIATWHLLNACEELQAAIQGAPPALSGVLSMPLGGFVLPFQAASMVQSRCQMLVASLARQLGHATGKLLMLHTSKSPSSVNHLQAAAHAAGDISWQLLQAPLPLHSLAMHRKLHQAERHTSTSSSTLHSAYDMWQMKSHKDVLPAYISMNFECNGHASRPKTFHLIPCYAEDCVLLA